ncbi:hypothetical protein [Ottowia sp.]|uniref:hypothetical protein n=1 Tax=Ottowia sp. TaxID=1898956 RepID=UPI002C702BFA|nr:hypothetical protein [Ottowia sp.]MCP5256320.1 hypothetical protein [Burkholderiaceae bacterium]HPR44056.1 hypothetical protein [Ottowia sp.]HRW73977.1 hypothetical protein [Ottowia sp.]
MSTLTSNQLTLLTLAVKFGLLSSEKYQEVIDWDRSERSYLDDINAEKAREPVRPRQTVEVSAAKLAIQITLREIELASESVDGPQKQRELAKLNRQLDRCRRELKEIVATNGISRSRKPTFLDEKKPVRPSMPEPGAAALQFISELISFEHDLCFVATTSSQSTIEPLSNRDIALCLRWNEVSVDPRATNSDEIWARFEELNSYRQCQLLSARCAELIMQSYYSKLTSAVVDISIQQLDESSCDWKDYDLRVGDRPVDVKNARKSLHGHGNFVEHCVPRFKEQRVTGEHVAIAGVLSEYINDPAKYRFVRTSATVLGEVNVVDVRLLYSWAKKRFGAKLDLKGIWNSGYLPGWLFEYPDAHYPRRGSTIKAISALATRFIRAGAFVERLPGWMFVFCGDEALLESLPLDDRKRKVVADLRSLANSIGISRRSLYVYAMGIALEAIADGLSPDDDLDALRQTIVMPLTSRESEIQSSMLGLADPLGYVESIVKLLSVIGNRLLEMQMRFSGFRLTHPAILKGICTDGSTPTLLAYCGGWQAVPLKAKCGTMPLTIFDDELCPSCAHLVCPNCGYCSHLCPECKPRQLDFVQLVQSENGGGHRYTGDADDFQEDYLPDSTW